MKDICREFPIDIYKRGLLVYIGDLANFHKYVNDNVPCYNECVKPVTEEYMENTDAVTIDCGNDVMIYAKKIQPIPIMVHELSHAATHICNQIGIDPSSDLEAYAYLLEYLTKEVFSWINALDDALLSLS